MNQTLKDFVIAHYDRMLPEPKRIFLRQLKLTPSSLARLIANCLDGWKIDCEIETKQIISIDYSNDPQELMEALKSHFAKQMAEMT
jgi:hypothetical protein